MYDAQSVGASAPEFLAIGVSDAVTDPPHWASGSVSYWNVPTNDMLRSECFTNQQFES